VRWGLILGKLSKKFSFDLMGLKTKCNLNISSSTYLRAKRGKGTFFKTLKYTPKSHKQKITKAQSTHYFCLLREVSYEKRETGLDNNKKRKKNKNKIK